MQLSVSKIDIVLQFAGVGPQGVSMLQPCEWDVHVRRRVCVTPRLKNTGDFGLE